MRGALEVNIGLVYGMDYVRQSIPMGGLRTRSVRRAAKEVSSSDQARNLSS